VRPLKSGMSILTSNEMNFSKINLYSSVSEAPLLESRLNGVVSS
jgi:hypothetical protein